ncbi:MAG: hypothetical protein ACRDWT_05095 [Jatrophihabitantaceae bacterium]
MKTNTLALCLLAAAALPLAGCAAAASSPPKSSSHQQMTAGMVMPDGSTMGAGQMTPGMVMPDGSTMAPGSPGTAPSAAAKMICTDETRDNIATVLSVTPDPKPAATWQGGTYTCTYRLPMGTIVLSVHESADVPAAAAYTARLRPAIADAKNLVGLTKTAFGTTNGVLVLQKDNDTLRVDTSGLQPQTGRLHEHRADFAYEIAAVIMGCWTGG